MALFDDLDGGTRTSGAARNLTGGQKWTLVVSCLSVALVIGSMAALYTDIAAQTGATQSQLTWVVDGYTLVLAGLVLPAGAVGDRYGRRAIRSARSVDRAQRSQRA
ncbi:arabinose efflux permease family protein [Mycobacteroides abscessus]|nr:arabinose efflux permease family protein [Mycobacteroides abscessus]